MGICNSKDKKLILINETLLFTDLCNDSIYLLYKIKENITYTQTKYIIKCCSSTKNNYEILKNILKKDNDIYDFVILNFDNNQILEFICINVYNNNFIESYNKYIKILIEKNIILDNYIELLDKIFKKDLFITKKNLDENKLWFYFILLKIIRNEKYTIEDTRTLMISNIIKKYFSNFITQKLIKTLIKNNVNINLFPDNYISDNYNDILFMKKIKNNTFYSVNF